MDGLRVKKELDDEEITIEYNDVATLNQTRPVKIARTKSKSLGNKECKTTQLERQVLIPYKTPKQEPISTNSNIKISQTYDENVGTKNLSISNINNNTADIVITEVDLEEQALKRIKVTKNKITVNCSNVSVPQNGQSESLKKNLKTPPSTSPIKNSSTSYSKPVHPLLEGATFLHTQVHSNPVLKSLLKDIVTLNNEKDDIDEDVLNEEIAKLRSANNLPSLNAGVSVNLEIEESDYSYGSEDETYSYYNLKSSENYGKDSGYDNDSQYSESLEEDNRSEVQENIGNEEKQLMITEPEYIDLDNYFVNGTTKPAITKGSLADIKNLKTYSFKQTCPDCKRTFKSKKTYKQHTQNGSGCIKECVTQNIFEQSNANEIFSSTEKQVSVTEDSNLFKCIGKCKFYGNEEELWEHTKKEHMSCHKSNAVLNLNSCKECYVTFANNSSLEKHYRIFHKKSLSCLFCDFVCDYLSDYNLHISSKHSKRLKTQESLEESDGIEIIEINDDE